MSWLRDRSQKGEAVEGSWLGSGWLSRGELWDG